MSYDIIIKTLLSSPAFFSFPILFPVSKSISPTLWRFKPFSYKDNLNMSSTSAPEPLEPVSLANDDEDTDVSWHGPFLPVVFDGSVFCSDDG